MATLEGDSKPGTGRRAFERGRLRSVGRSLGGLWRHPVLFAVVRRLVLSVPVLVLVSALIFVLTALLPGNVTWTILGGPPGVSGVAPSRYKLLGHQLGLDQSLPVRYWHWLTAAIHGDLGKSLFTYQPVTQQITERLPVTISLIIGALVISLVVGVALGVVSAVRGGAVGRGVDVLAMGGWVLPGFWIMAQLVVLFAVEVKVFPAVGYVPFTESPGRWFHSLVLPWVALSLAAIGLFAKFTRQEMMDALSSEYVLMARANGVTRASIIFRHAFKTASLQVVTQAGMFTISLLLGSIFAEIVFALPGLGSLLIDSATNHDLPVVEGVAVFFTLIVILVNLVTDLIYGLLSPKVRTE